MRNSPSSTCPALDRSLFTRRRFRGILMRNPDIPASGELSAAMWSVFAGLSELLPHPWHSPSEGLNCMGAALTTWRTANPPMARDGEVKAKAAAMGSMWTFRNRFLLVPRPSGTAGYGPMRTVVWDPQLACGVSRGDPIRLFYSFGPRDSLSQKASSMSSSGDQLGRQPSLHSRYHWLCLRAAR